MGTVLIVDDEPLIRWSLAESLEAEGFAVLEAGSAREALQRMADRDGIAVVILDLKLPDSADLSLLQHIRRLAPYCQVILMTAHGTPELLDEARRVGAYDALSKPFDMAKIVGLVRAASAV